MHGDHRLRDYHEPHGAHSSLPFETAHDVFIFTIDDDESLYEDRNPRSIWDTALL